MTIENLPAPPEAPEPAHCCRRGCCPCIFDYYDAAFNEWEAEVRAAGFEPADVLAMLGQTHATRPAKSSL